MIIKFITKQIYRVRNYLEQVPKNIIFVCSLTVAAIIAYIDYISRYEINHSIFYIIPIIITAWYYGKRGAVIVSVTSMMLIIIINIASGLNPRSLIIIALDAFLLLVFFLFISYILLALKKSLINEKRLARTDTLTGIANQRNFYERAEIEIYKANRYQHPLSLAYIDVDNFKQTNDTLGHLEGNKLLIMIAQTMAAGIRTSDIVARIGGDEFAILLPETGNEQAHAIISKVHENLIKKVQEEKYQVSFSIGVVTCALCTPDFDSLIHRADMLMYEVKKSGKNNIKFDLN